MRLIDANALLKVFKALISAYRQVEGKHNWGDHCRIPAFEFMDALKSAKTIEAIPIQFIEMWMNENLTNGEDDGEVDTIFEMIRDWEQEGKEYEYKSM